MLYFEYRGKTKKDMKLHTVCMHNLLSHPKAYRARGSLHNSKHRDIQEC